MVFKQSNFSRSLANDKKMGAYYTNTEMCKRIGYLFSFPEEEEVSILEPSCGDLTALESFLLSAKAKAELSRIFGVELNPETYEKVNDKCHACINADFLTGVKISHNVFGFCFANPPYGTDDAGVRLEQRFVEKLWAYLKNGCPIAYIIPYYVASDEKFLKSFLARFDLKGVYRFDDEIYKQFQQVVLVGVKKKSVGVLRSKAEAWLKNISNLDDLAYLPTEPEEQPLMAVPSKESDVEYFTSLLFPAAEAAKNLYRSPLKNRLDEFMVPKFTGNMIGRPPVPLKKDLLYLLAVSGGGQGLVGSEESCDMHLQRGVAKVIKKDSKNMESGVLTEKTFTQICLTIIENDGKISELQ